MRLLPGLLIVAIVAVAWAYCYTAIWYADRWFDGDEFIYEEDVRISLAVEASYAGCEAGLHKSMAELKARGYDTSVDGRRNRYRWSKSGDREDDYFGIVANTAIEGQGIRTVSVNYFYAGRNRWMVPFYVWFDAWPGKRRSLEDVDDLAVLLSANCGPCLP